VRVRCDYDGWDPADRLDPGAESVLSFLERLAKGRLLSDSEDILASIDEYGVLRATVPCGTSSELFLQAGDGWDRVLWTCPSGRRHEWSWEDDETPADIDALLAGRGVERTTMLRSRAIAVELVVEGRTLATTEGGLRLSLVRRLGVRLRTKDEPALTAALGPMR
jgi:hypothetical protein